VPSRGYVAWTWPSRLVCATARRPGSPGRASSPHCAAMRRIAAAPLQLARSTRPPAGWAAPGRPDRQPRHRASLPGAVPLGLLARGHRRVCAGAVRSWAALPSPLSALGRMACALWRCRSARGGGRGQGGACLAGRAARSRGRAWARREGWPAGTKRRAAPTPARPRAATGAPPASPNHDQRRPPAQGREASGELRRGLLDRRLARG
jgi:hypothetical protein